MSFLRMKKSLPGEFFGEYALGQLWHERPEPRRFDGFKLATPRRAALPLSPPLLHQPGRILQHR